ncbi:MAG: hypothetical protein NT121_21710, partial [Chloroflexi bacterium]|nr:hypothetical protein [Chloroflexota bacterium]
YRECLPLSAFNQCLRLARNANYNAFTALPKNQKSYRAHPNSLNNINIFTHLDTIGANLGLQYQLSSEYHQRLQILQNSSLHQWEQLISGKYVLTLIKERFPINMQQPSVWDSFLSLYMSKYLAPPPDLAQILDAIYSDSQTP